MLSMGGDTLDIKDLGINEYTNELSDLNFITSGNPEMMKEGNMTGSMLDVINRLNASISKNPQIFDAAFKEQQKRTQGFREGGMVSPKYPAFNMPSDRRPNAPVSKPPKPKMPSANKLQVTPSENLGLGPNQVSLNRFRPKRKPPMGVPQPKPYNPFSQEMNQFG